MQGTVHHVRVAAVCSCLCLALGTQTLLMVREELSGRSEWAYAALKKVSGAFGLETRLPSGARQVSIEQSDLSKKGPGLYALNISLRGASEIHTRMPDLAVALKSRDGKTIASGLFLGSEWSGRQNLRKDESVSKTIYLKSEAGQEAFDYVAELK